MKNRSHFTAPFLINNSLLDGIAAKVLKDYQQKKGDEKQTSLLLAKPSTNPKGQKGLAERPWDRAGIGAELLSNQQKQTQLSQSCFHTEDELPSAIAIGDTVSSSGAAGTKELDSLRKVVLGVKGRPQQDTNNEGKPAPKKASVDDEHSKFGTISNKPATNSAFAKANDHSSQNQQHQQLKKKKKGNTATPAAPVRERVVEMAEGVEDYEEDERLAKKLRPE